MPKFTNIFDWSAWDDIGLKCFYYCELLMDIGEFKSGDEFDNIQFDDEKLILYFYKNTDDYYPCMIKKLGIIE
jgi:hypothetical protein